MQRGICAILILILSMAFVLAAGGGGGEGGGSSSGGSVAPGSSRPMDEFTSLVCTDDGRVSFTILNSTTVIAFREGSDVNVTLLGTWEGDSFTSEEATFMEAGMYGIISGKTKAQVTCPGVKIACKLVGLQNLTCASGSQHQVTFSLINDSALENLKLSFRTASGILIYTVNSRSAPLKNLQLTQDGDKVTVRGVTLTGVSEVEVIHQKCIGKRYLYARAKCDTMQNASIVQDSKVDPQTLKCGGLLDISDRVRCRINLESEQAEYNNFFPEECRNHKDPDRCLAIYRQVSECWDLEPYTVRRDCLASHINLTTTMICTDSACRKAESEKRLTMIKLRFYNLEEQAEILEERGKLDREKLIPFVVEIELKKKKINAAKNKEEIAQIIREAQTLWAELMKEVKP